LGLPLYTHTHEKTAAPTVTLSPLVRTESWPRPAAPCDRPWRSIPRRGVSQASAWSASAPPGQSNGPQAGGRAPRRCRSVGATQMCGPRRRPPRKRGERRCGKAGLTWVVPAAGEWWG